MSTPWPAVALIALLGLVVGSFLNVVIDRVPREESVVHPKSHCPRCRTQTKRRHAVPVLSWLVLRGRRACCRAQIKARHPMVEGGTALLFAVITLRFGLSDQLPAYLYLAAVGVSLALIDIELCRLPDSLVNRSYVVGVLLLLPVGVLYHGWGPAARALVTMAVLWFGCLALAAINPNTLRFDDAKIAGLFGLYTGWVSWATALCGAMAGILIIGMARRANHGPNPVILPLAACLIAAAGLALLLTMPIVTWYSSILPSA